MKFTQRRVLPLFFVMGAGAVIALRARFPERGLYEIGPRALLDSLFALSLAGLVLLIAGGVGHVSLRKILGTDAAGLEAFIFSPALGLGILAYGILILGLVGWLTPLHIALWLLAAALAGWRGMSWYSGQVKALAGKLRGELASLPVIFRIGAFLGAGVLLLTLLSSLAPPSDYDGLMYHLQAPLLFLQSGKIVILDGLWQANGPATIEMLFMAGLAFGTDAFSQIIHFAYFVLFLAAAFGFYRRHLAREGALVPALILLGIPVLPLIAASAYTDFGWALHEFLGLWALINWLQKRGRAWLVLSGCFMGLAMGTKYLALGGAALLGFWILLDGRRSPRSAARDLLWYALPALLIASPWYLKNWVLGGNPFYPFLFPTPGWEASRSALLDAYLKSFGAGRTPWDFIALPVRLYTRHLRFYTSISIDTPSFLFPIALLYFFRRDSSLLNRLGFYSLAWFAVWSLGSQQTRFLIPVYPIWAAITAHLLLSLRPPRLRYVLTGSLFLGLLLITLIYQSAGLLARPVLGVVLGTSSKAAYLEKAVNNFRATQYARAHLPSGSRVLMLWDGRSYYCRDLCIPDAEEDIWVRLASLDASRPAIITELSHRGITHLLVVNPEWHIRYHDPGGLHRKAYALLQNDYLPACALQLYQDEVAVLYELRCTASG